MGWFFKRNTVTIHQFRTRAKIEGLAATIVTDVGNVRSNNEDNALICYPREAAALKSKGCLLILADGMGGHNSGEVASELAITVFANTYFNRSGNTIKSLQYALKEANRHIYAASVSDPKCLGMGTTLTAVLVKDDDLFLIHVGDSRAYLMGADALQRISKDQTLVQQLLEQGEITETEAATRPDRNVLLNALGTKPDCYSEIRRLRKVMTGENTILICSDGLYDLVSDETIRQFLENTDNLEEIGAGLVAEAKRNGGHDNITVLLATRREQASIPALKNTQDFEIPLTNEINKL